MLKYLLVFLVLFNFNFSQAKNDMDNTVIEILTWGGLKNVSDEEMIDAVDAMTEDLKELPGFLHQSLYKNSNNEWIDVYYWTNEKDAHLSNERMENKESLNNLLKLIDINTIKMEVMKTKQQSSNIRFD